MYFHGLLIYLFLQCRLAFTQDLNDVTTVYSIGQNIQDDFAYVHLANKNATSKFMSLMIGDRLIDLATSEQENLRHWEEANRTFYFFTYYHHGYQIAYWYYYGPTNSYSNCFLTQDVPINSLDLSKYVPFNKFTYFSFKLDSVEICKTDVKLILTETDEPIRNQKQFYFITTDSCTFNFYKCNGTFGSDHVYINHKKFTCWNVRSIVGRQYLTMLECFIKQSQEEIRIDFFGYNSQESQQFALSLLKFLEWEDDSPISIHFFAIHASNSKTKTNILIKVYTAGESFLLSTNGPWRSKWFIPAQKKQCMTLIFKCPTGGSFNPLHIYLENEGSSDKTYLGGVGKYCEGWQIESVILTRPEENGRVRFALEASTVGLYVENIYILEMDDTIGCSSKDKGITALLRTDYKNAISKNVITLARTNYSGEISAMAVLINSDLRKRKPVSFLPNKIYNSGSTECEFYKNPCPPGFIGTDCEQGCGKNRFGSDCNSLCSSRRTGCRGLLLCTPSVGCVCPPGYRGETCEEECENGFYGNNCSQICGQCKEDTCDIYTGKCSLCQPGYYPPLCKQKCAVVSSAPHLNVTSFGEVTVIPDFSNITGKSQPEFYSVEYRKLLSFSPWIKYVTLLFPKSGDPQRTVIKGLEHCVGYEVRIVLFDKDLNSYKEDGYVPTAIFASQCTKYAVVSSAPHLNVTSFGEVTVIPDFSNITGKSQPEYYSVEYRKLLSFSTWIKYATPLFPKSGDPQRTVMKGLEYGVRYEVRIVLFDKDLNSYKGDGYVRTAIIASQCTIPDTDLILETYSDESLVTVSWEFKNNETKQSNYWCPVEHFEVYWKQGWKWFSANTTDKKISLHNQLPAMAFEFKVRALTHKGYTLYSPTAHVSTASSSVNTEPVKNLTVSVVDSTSAVLRWQPPLMYTEIMYIVEYQCIIRLACQKDCSNGTAEVSTTHTEFRLVDLLPFSQYLVTVYPVLGPNTDSPNVIFSTLMTDQLEIPERHTKMPSSTNTSVTVYWKKPEICSGIFSNFYYQLLKEDDLLRECVTLDTNVTIEGLIPRTDYKVRIYVELLTKNINQEKYLEINVSTSASDKVANLTVYKQGESLLGIRWAVSENIHGKLRSFKVITKLNGAVVKSAVVEPTPCIVWPHLFCYSITSLNANKIYTVSVSARNCQIRADGATVTGVTTEKLPSAPENVQVLSVTSTTVNVQWDYPFLVNGILRTFVLNLEETDRFESDKCCEIYPLIEIPVKEELEHYLTKVTGMKPASTYELSISAKTVSLGPSQRLTVRTRPPQIPATQPNVTTNLLHDGWHWLNNSDSSEPYSYEIYSSLIREPMLLLVVTNDTAVIETGITDDALNKELKSIIPGNFYLAHEYTDECSDINIGDGTVVDGTSGKVRNIPLKIKTDYQLAAVRVTYYKGIYNLAVTLTTVFATA